MFANFRTNKSRDSEGLNPIPKVRARTPGFTSGRADVNVVRLTPDHHKRK